jgi:uncharacterized membrane protein
VSSIESDGIQEHTFWSVVRTTFGRGVAVMVPLVITFWVLNMLFNSIDGVISPVFDQILQRHIPGLGFISMVVLIFIVGALSRNLVGRGLLRAFEHLISSIPLARTIYSAMRDVINAFQPGRKGKSFREVVIVEYPRPGLSTIGFVTNEIVVSRGISLDQLVSVYIPNPPNPTSGILLLVPRKEARVLNMTVEEGLKLVLSGGIVTSIPLELKEDQRVGKE